MVREQDSWYDEAAGPLVRMYGFTRGRTHDVAPDLSMITIVVAVPGTADARLRQMDPEYQRIVAIAQNPRAIAEVAARLGLPVRVSRILVGDLISDGYLTISSTQAKHAAENNNRETADLVRAIRDGLLRL